MSKITIAGMQRAAALADARRLATKAERLRAETAFVRTWIERKHLLADPELQQMAWVQYRYMTPLERTELFTRTYRDMYIKLYAKHFPEGDVDKKQPIDVEFARNESRVMNAMWRARAEADMAGVPYDVHLETVMEAHLVNDHWKQLPRPNQLYGKMVQPRVRGLPTIEQISERLYGPDWDERFGADQYIGDPVQEQAIRLMQRVVENALDPAAVLGMYLCDRRCLPLDRALTAFKSSLVHDAIARSARPPVEHGAKTGRQYIPGCFGNVRLEDDSCCQVCPVVNQCIAFAGRVRDEVVRATGSEDPRKEWRKMKGRERQQRFRDNAKRDEMLERLRSQGLDKDDVGTSGRA